MLRFKQFLITEELTDSQRNHFNSLPRDSAAVAATDHYFGKGNDVVTHRLNDTMDKSEIHHAVEHHLGQEIPHNDYKNGIFTDQYGREVRIGSQLKKTRAPSSLVDNFANDSTRQSKNYTGLHAVVTRSPGGDPSKGDLSGVAGQTSSNQSWENQSCKNVDTGKHKGILPDEIKHGTVVTYLKDHTGKELARATLQPHTNTIGHTIYSPDSYYGIEHDPFHRHVEQLAKDLTTPYRGGSITYTKNENVYNDNGVSEILHPNLTSADLNKALEDRSPEVRASALDHPNITPSHIHKALDDEDVLIRTKAAGHVKATAKNLDKALGDQKSVEVRLTALQSPNIKPYQIDRALQDSDKNVRLRAISHPSVSPVQISKALEDSYNYLRAKAIEHPNATKSNIEKALRDSDYLVRQQAIANKNATSDQITRVMKNDNVQEVRKAALKNPNAQAYPHIEMGLHDIDDDMRRWAASSPNITSAQLDKALNDPYPFTRLAAINNKNATEDHLMKGREDESPSVRNAAIQNLHFMHLIKKNS